MGKSIEEYVLKVAPEADQMALLGNLTVRAEALGGMIYWTATHNPGVFIYKRPGTPNGLFRVDNAYQPYRKREGRGKWLFQLPDDLYALKNFIETDEQIFVNANPQRKD